MIVILTAVGSHDYARVDVLSRKQPCKESDGNAADSSNTPKPCWPRTAAKATDRLTDRPTFRPIGRRQRATRRSNRATLSYSCGPFLITFCGSFSDKMSCKMCGKKNAPRRPSSRHFFVRLKCGLNSNQRDQPNCCVHEARTHRDRDRTQTGVRGVRNRVGGEGDYKKSCTQVE